MKIDIRKIHVESYVGDYEPSQRDIYGGSNYCYNCWKQFTTLTTEERHNLVQIRLAKGIKKRGRVAV